MCLDNWLVMRHIETPLLNNNDNKTSTLISRRGCYSPCSGCTKLRLFIREHNAVLFLRIRERVANIKKEAEQEATRKLCINVAQGLDIWLVMGHTGPPLLINSDNETSTSISREVFYCLCSKAPISAQAVHHIRFEETCPPFPCWNWRSRNPFCIVRYVQMQDWITIHKVCCSSSGTDYVEELSGLSAFKPNLTRIFWIGTTIIIRMPWTSKNKGIGQ